MMNAKILREIALIEAEIAEREYSLLVYKERAGQKGLYRKAIEKENARAANLLKDRAACLARSAFTLRIITEDEWLECTHEFN